MTEVYPSDAELNVLSGTNDDDHGVLFPAIGESPYYTSFYKMLSRLLLATGRAGDLRVYKDGDLTFGVRAGEYLNGDTAVSYAGATGQSLTDDATNYIYLTAAGSLTVNTTGFPTPSDTPHLPLATIATGTQSQAAVSGRYEISDIVDYRGRCILQAAGVTAALQQNVRNLLITAGAEDGSDKRTITVQARDGADNNLAQRFLVRLWIAQADFAAPDATGNTVAVESGAAYETETPHAAYKLITDATGKTQTGLTITGAASRYVMAEIDGRVYSSGEITWAT